MLLKGILTYIALASTACAAASHSQTFMTNQRLENVIRTYSNQALPSKSELVEDPSLLFNPIAVAKHILLGRSSDASGDGDPVRSITAADDDDQKCSNDVAAMLADYGDRVEWARRSE